MGLHLFLLLHPVENAQHAVWFRYHRKTWRPFFFAGWEATCAAVEPLQNRQTKNSAAIRRYRSYVIWTCDKLGVPSDVLR